MINQLETIFLAEDDEDDCLIFLEVLKRLDIRSEVIVCRDGEELMHNLHLRVPPIPKVVFLDLNMPRKNGVDCLAEIRATEKFEEVLIVILSTSSEIKDINITHQLGANYYMPKPGDFAQLTEGIKKVLELNILPRTATPKSEFLLRV